MRRTCHLRIVSYCASVCWYISFVSASTPRVLAATMVGTPATLITASPAYIVASVCRSHSFTVSVIREIRSPRWSCVHARIARAKMSVGSSFRESRRFATSVAESIPAVRYRSVSKGYIHGSVYCTSSAHCPGGTPRRRSSPSAALTLAARFAPILRPYDATACRALTLLAACRARCKGVMRLRFIL